MSHPLPTRAPKPTLGTRRSDSPPVDRGPRDNAPPRVGLALSAGGARGLAHVGVIQILEEHGIPVHAVAGTSMGAYVGSLWAAGLKGDRLEELASEIKTRRDFRRLADYNIPPLTGLIHGRRMRAHLMRDLGERCFTDLERDFYAVACDLDSYTKVVLRDGLVADAVLASCAIPGVVVPVRLGGRRLVDGGVVDPLPVSVLRHLAAVDVVIAVNVVPTVADVRRCARRNDHHLPDRPSPWRRLLAAVNHRLNLFAPGNVLDTFERSLRAAQVRLAEVAARRADVHLHPVFCDASWKDYENFEKYIDLGRRLATGHLPALRALTLPAPAAAAGATSRRPGRATKPASGGNGAATAAVILTEPPILS